MTVSAHDYLADLYRLEELEGWRLLSRHLELTDGFSFVVVLAPDDAAVAYLRSRLPDLLGSPNAVRRVAFNPWADVGSLTNGLLEIVSLPESVRLIWVDADPVEPDRIPERDEAWRASLSRLNRYRNTLQDRIRCTLALAGPVSLQTILREAAPDLWSIRSAVFRIEPAGSARGIIKSSDRETEEPVDPGEMGLPGDPAETLAEAEKLRRKPGREVLLAQLLRRAGRQAFRLLQWDLALQCLQEAYGLEEAHGGDPELRFQIANEIALVFQTLGQWDRALHYSRKAREIAEAHFGPMHPNAAVAYNNLARLLQAMNQPAEAARLVRQALAIDEQSFGADHPKVATSLNHLALLLRDTHRIAEAEPLMRRALAIDERHFGGDHPNVARDLSNLALLLRDTNRLAEAEQLMRRALAIGEKSLGANHPNVATRLNNLAMLLQDTNRLAEAEPLMRQALAIDRHNFGANHPEVAIDLNNLARLLQDTHRPAEAEPLMRRALAIDEESFGRRHPKVARDLSNLAQVLQATNDLAEAENLMRQAQAIDEICFGAWHPAVAIDLNNLALLLQATGRVGEAEPLFRLSVEILLSFGRRNGYEHPHLRAVLANYQKALKELGETDGAIRANLENLGAQT
jgi:tetratricopeptide (TPR) repeat protein